MSIKQRTASFALTRPIAWVLCLCCIVIASQLQAAPKAVLLVASKDSQVYQDVLTAVDLGLSNTEVTLGRSFEPDRLSAASLKSYDLIVTVGTLATERVIKLSPNAPVLSTFIPKQTFETLAAAAPVSLQSRLSALYLEQPLGRQLQLLRALSPDTRRLGTVVSENSKNHLKDLNIAAAKLRWQLVADELNVNDNPIEVLTPIISEADAFLALPDRAVINRSTAKWILLMTFRQRIPLIAFSRSYVEAGALAAIFSTPQSVGTEAAELIRNWLEKPEKPLPPPGYPSRFDLSVNWGTAQSLGIAIESETALKERLQGP